MITNQKGFTLIEIIAVLVILGILAAAAVPKYISLQEEARRSSAQSAIAELKGRASHIYAMKALRSAGQPTCAAVAASLQASYAAGSAGDMLPDFTVSADNCAGSSPEYIRLRVSYVKGTQLTPAVTGSWIFPLFGN